MNGHLEGVHNPILGGRKLTMVSKPWDDPPSTSKNSLKEPQVFFNNPYL